MTDLSDTAHKLVASGKGIFAHDETVPHADRWLEEHGIGSGPEKRREYRDLFLAAPGIENYLSGVILYKETLDQQANDGTPFPELLRAKGVMPGIKVDDGLEPMPESPDESITKGLLGLPERLLEYRTKYETGFTKWRATIRIEGDRLPTSRAIVENAKRLAAYACEVQKVGMVPIVEPEVLLEGTHSRVRSRAVLETVYGALVDALHDQAADISGVILKTSMALSGSGTGKIDTPEEVATDTVAALMAHIPAEMPGIVFLSGGQTPEQAIQNLAAITKEAREKQVPWPLTFSYARAFQEEALTVWQGKPEQVEAAREVYLARLKQAQDAIT